MNLKIWGGCWHLLLYISFAIIYIPTYIYVYLWSYYEIKKSNMDLELIFFLSRPMVLFPGMRQNWNKLMWFGQRTQINQTWRMRSNYRWYKCGMNYWATPKISKGNPNKYISKYRILLINNASIFTGVNMPKLRRETSQFTCNRQIHKGLRVTNSFSVHLHEHCFN